MQTQTGWNLEQAREDYLKIHPKKPSKKTCADCMFGSMDFEGDIYCGVKEKFIYLCGYTAKRCKYFTSKYPYKNYKK